MFKRHAFTKKKEVDVYFQSGITPLLNSVVREFDVPIVYFVIVRGDTPSLDVLTKISSASFGEKRTSRSLYPAGRCTATSVVALVVKSYINILLSN